DTAGILVERGIIKALRRRQSRICVVAKAERSRARRDPVTSCLCAMSWRAHPRPPHPGANAEEAFAAWRIARVRSADRRHGPKCPAGHWRLSRYRASAHARLAARVRQPRDARWLRLSPSDAGRMTNRPRRIGRAASWDSNTVLLYPAKF